MAKKTKIHKNFNTITQRLLELIERDTIPWHRPWHKSNLSALIFSSTIFAGKRDFYDLLQDTTAFQVLWNKNDNLEAIISVFNLPDDISYYQEQLPNGVAFNFRHSLLGDLGRILLQDRADGQTQILCEVVGDPDDPMTAQRAAILEPIGKGLSAHIDRVC